MSKRPTNQSRPSGAAKRPCSPLINTTSGASPELNVGLPAALARMPSSLLQKEGWKGLMREIDTRGVIVVTHDDRPEAVVLSTDSFERLASMAGREQARQDQQLAELNERVDQKLACLSSPHGRQALDAFMDEPLVLDGKLRVRNAP